MRNPHAWIRMADAPAIRSQVVRVVASSLWLAVATTALAADTASINNSFHPTWEFYPDYNAAFTKSWKAKTGGLVMVMQSRRCSGKKAPGGDRRPSGRWRDAGAQGRRRRYN